MSPYVPELRLKLNYPLYAADFDPLNQDFLLVGGGGGSSSTGVPNKISLIDTSRRDALAEITDIELAKDEDSVTTLAVATSSETSLTAVAGINSSAADQSAGKNEHLRTFRIPLPRKRRADGTAVDTSEKAPANVSTQALGRTALFRSAQGAKNETYQRVLRASPVKTSSEARIAVIASGLAPENEIIAFQPVANSRSSAIDEISRISLGKTEAADVDVLPAKESGQILAYCTDGEVFVQQLHSSKETKVEDTVSVYQCPDSDASVPPGKRPKFRALRLLTPKHILLLQNLPGRTGVALLVLRLNQDCTQGRITLQKRLNKSMKTAVGLDVCSLSESPAGEKQIIIAVAGQDGSIELLTIDYAPNSGVRTFKPYTVLRNIHSGPLTRLVLANFVGPTIPVDKGVGPQSVRMASVGVDQVVVVHTLHLRSDWNTDIRSPRYVLVPPGKSDTIQTTFSVFIALVVLGVSALIMQVFCEIRGAVPPTLGATDWLSPRVSQAIARPYIFASDIPLAVSDIPALSSAIDKIKAAPSQIPTWDEVKTDLQDLVSQQSELETPKAIVVRDQGPGELSAELHHDAELIKEEALKKWEDLSEKQKHGWKQKLRDAGHWAENQGESVLKGILFSELAGLVA